jgi:hypothetical protein
LLQPLDIAFVHVEFEYEFARLVGSLHHDRDPFPFGPPFLKPALPEPTEPFRQRVANLFGNALAFVSGGKAGIEEQRG